MFATYYDKIMQGLRKYEECTQLEWREFAGQSFLYVTSPLQADKVMQKLLEEGDTATQGTKLKVECFYVRTQGDTHVYRFRLVVPNEKMFCCGNFCADCILLRN